MLENNEISMDSASVPVYVEAPVRENATHEAATALVASVAGLATFATIRGAEYVIGTLDATTSVQETTATMLKNTPVIEHNAFIETAFPLGVAFVVAAVFNRRRIRSRQENR